MVWSHQFGTASYDLVLAAAVDGAGNVILTGFTGGDLAAPNAGESDAFLLRLAPEVEQPAARSPRIRTGPPGAFSCSAPGVLPLP